MKSRVAISLFSLLLVVMTTSGLLAFGKLDAERSDSPESPAMLQSVATFQNEAGDADELITDGRTVWKHLSSKSGDIPDPGTQQQTSAMIFDVDNSGVNDIVIGSRFMAPSVSWFRPEGDSWTRYVIDDTVLPLEAGGAYYDITGNGALDFVIGEDATGNKVYWWENPYPNYDPDVPWVRHEVKNTGASKHHDQVFGDFTGNGRTDLAFWNQGASTLFLAEIPDDPVNTSPWPMTAIFTYTGAEMEGLAAGDINGDGVVDIVGGGRWFEHVGGTQFVPHVIDDQLRFGTAAVGELVENGRLDVVFSAADLVGPIRWYEQTASGDWIAHDLLGHDIDHGHSVEIEDIDGDGHLDIFAAEMRLDDGNEDAGMWIFYGDGAGNFTQSEVAIGIGNHESKVGDLNGDGRLDILGKPYNWDTPRLDVWLNMGSVEEIDLPLDQWQRHVIDDNKPWRSLFVTAADVNGSGHQDIITGGWWYENPGVPGTSWTRHTIGAPLNNMAAVYDFDGDGHVDILGTKGIGSETNAEFVWARNDGAGNFTIHDNIQTAQGTFLQGVAVERFQNDQLGVALSWHDTEVGVQMLTVPENPEFDTWAWEQISAFSQGEDLSVGDINGDGRLDLLLGTAWLRNDGGSWSTHTLHETHLKPDRNVLADINGNGKLDAVIGYEDSSQATVLAWYEQGDDPTDVWTEHVIANIVGPMSLDVRDMNHNGALDVIVGEHNLVDPGSSRMLVYENADGVGGSWVEHVVYIGDEHHMGAQVADMYGDSDSDIISIGWEHNLVLLYENRALTSALNRHLAPVSPPVPVPDEGRVTIGLQALYTFEEGSGDVVHDVSGAGDALDLHIGNSDAIDWGEGHLNVHSSTLISSDQPAAKLIDAFKGSNALTVEAWITPENAVQSGPARILTISGGLLDRNFTFGHGEPGGQPGALFESRLRTTATSSNGQPGTVSPAGSGTTNLTHLVFTRDGNGIARLYVDGVQVANRTVGGSISNWNSNFALGLANEFGADRPWLGTYHLVAFYDRALGGHEVAHNFEEGPDADSTDPPPPPPEVTWLDPASGAVLSGDATLRVEASAGTARVEFGYDSGGSLTPIGSTTSSNPDGSWSVTWDTTGVSDGSYQLVATAFDAASGGNALASATRSVSVLNSASERVTDGLLVLYGFNEGSGNLVHDVSGVGTPLDLEIQNPGSAVWGNGSLALDTANRIASPGPATKVTTALQASNALTLEAWITPQSAAQAGPARVVTISQGLTDRNLMLGQGDPMGGSASRYETRLRTTSTSANGVPSLASPANSATAALQHVVYTRDAGGAARIYIDGTLVASTTIGGNLSNWNSTYRLALGNEIGQERPWLGTYHLVAVYNRALSESEVGINFSAGPDGESGDPPAQVTWLDPTSEAVLNGDATLRVEASSGTARVEFGYDSGGSVALVGTASSSNPDGNWSITWDTTGVSDGTYQLVATAFDAANGGNALDSATRSISVRNDETARITDGLLVLYGFNEGSGNLVHDVSGVGSPLDLEIQNPGSAVWGNGSLALDTANRIASPGTATKVTTALQASNALTLEAWITPQSAAQPGPARVVTISQGLTDRNLMLGQGDPMGGSASRYETRLRTTSTNANGVPSLASPANSAAAALQHVVYTRDTNGTARVYIDGQLIASDTIGGNLSNWNGTYRLALGNEIGQERPWLGTYHLVAIYGRALSESEVGINFSAGPDGESGDPPAQVIWIEPDANALLSEDALLRVDAAQGTVRVEFSYDNSGSLVSIGTASDGNPDETWSVTWDTTSVSDGTYQLVATAYDAANGGNALASATRSVSVLNGVPERVTDGLLVLYDFEDSSEDLVRDVSGVGDPLDLEIENPTDVVWEDGTLTLDVANRIVSPGPATKVTTALQASNSLTLEAWITPQSAAQPGPARVMTISQGLTDRNLMLGQGDPMGGSASRYETRLRTTSTNANGVPSLVSPANSATATLQHVVYTRDAGGAARIYIDGTLVASSTIGGNLNNWNGTYRLALGNEIGEERPWLGTYHLVAVYDRALAESEVQFNFIAGPATSAGPAAD